MYTPKDYHGVIPLNAVPIKSKDGKVYNFIAKNSILCKKCNTVITSKFQHDFVKCKCGKCFVDGGLAYSRVGFETPDDFTDLSEFKTATEEQYQEWLDAHKKLEQFKEKEHKKFLKIYDSI